MTREEEVERAVMEAARITAKVVSTLDNLNTPAVFREVFVALVPVRRSNTAASLSETGYHTGYIPSPSSFNVD